MRKCWEHDPKVHVHVAIVHHEFVTVFTVAQDRETFKYILKELDRILSDSECVTKLFHKRISTVEKESLLSSLHICINS